MAGQEIGEFDFESYHQDCLRGFQNRIGNQSPRTLELDGEEGSTIELHIGTRADPQNVSRNIDMLTIEERSSDGRICSSMKVDIDTNEILTFCRFFTQEEWESDSNIQALVEQNSGILFTPDDQQGRVLHEARNVGDGAISSIEYLQGGRRGAVPLVVQDFVIELYEKINSASENSINTEVPTFEQLCQQWTQYTLGILDESAEISITGPELTLQSENCPYHARIYDNRETGSQRIVKVSVYLPTVDGDIISSFEVDATTGKINTFSCKVPVGQSGVEDARHGQMVKFYGNERTIETDANGPRHIANEQAIFIGYGPSDGLDTQVPEVIQRNFENICLIVDDLIHDNNLNLPANVDRRVLRSINELISDFYTYCVNNDYCRLGRAAIATLENAIDGISTEISVDVYRDDASDEILRLIWTRPLLREEDPEGYDMGDRVVQKSIILYNISARRFEFLDIHGTHLRQYFPSEFLGNYVCFNDSGYDVYDSRDYLSGDNMWVVYVNEHNPPSLPSEFYQIALDMLNEVQRSVL